VPVACIANAGDCQASAAPAPPTDSVWSILRREMLEEPACLSRFILKDPVER
jgi:hypothetical protein